MRPGIARIAGSAQGEPPAFVGRLLVSGGADTRSTALAPVHDGFGIADAMLTLTAPAGPTPKAGQAARS